MNAREYLSQAMWLDKIINQKLEEQERLKALAEKTTPSYSPVKVTGGERKNIREEHNVKLIDLKYELDETVDRFVDLKREIMDTINQLDELKYQLLLAMRYIDGKSWNEVAVVMGYDKRYTLKLHDIALKKIEKIMKKNKKDTKKHLPTTLEGDIV
ncbi:uncharacterized protein DUF1492 [Natranaerovirga pectinivora]|uniref:Uncharacterized protein DUF1492 n=1 Tax=Natranaerovirga pectinivora TaxID=682400 RepID=A0A4R3MP47_9FIRM|nr:DUF1492 domain-containing protein [Natranaerovirga pectinivora]TCT14594.1 uncharacterized protein DUF1492 [Natranaerovirga pectinivora]